MASNKLIDTVNDQLNFEYYSAYIYLGMSAYFSEKGLNGFANWMMVQAQEEMTHAKKIYMYMLSRGWHIKLLPIDAPKANWKSELDVMQAALKHEQLVSARFNNLAGLAGKDKDHASSIFLQWFITEQVQEEQSFNDIVLQLKLIGSDGRGLLMLDRELGARQFVDETATAAAGA